MARLIDADELRTRMLDYYSYSWQLCEEINDFFKNTPTVDPVKHGRWEWIGGYGYQYRCSECIVCVERPTNYCPNCGAYMMGEDGDAE